MKIRKKDLFVQVIYRKLAGDFDIPRHNRGMNAELYMSMEEIGAHDRKMLDAFAAYLKEKGLKLRAHAPIMTLDYDDPALAGRLADMFKKVFDLYGRLGITDITTHAEFYYDKGFSIEGQYRNAFPVWAGIADQAKSGGFRVLLENHLEKDPSLITGLLNKVNKKDSLQACFDIGHYNMCCEDDPVSCLKKYPGGTIKEVHLADNLGDADSHLVLGKGNIDFAGFFREMDRRGDEAVYTLEPLNAEDIDDSLQYLRKSGVLID
jgi:sugar phosphate isomerase/epimerase